MKVLFDTNVILDAVAKDRPYHRVAIRLFDYVLDGSISAFVAPTSLTTTWYLAVEHHSTDPRPFFRAYQFRLQLALMTEEALQAALAAPFDSDFEDEYVAASGEIAGAEAVVTRNEKDFQRSTLEVYHPNDLVLHLSE